MHTNGEKAECTFGHFQALSKRRQNNPYNCYSACQERFFFFFFFFNQRSDTEREREREEQIRPKNV